MFHPLACNLHEFSCNLNATCMNLHVLSCNLHALSCNFDELVLAVDAIPWKRAGTCTEKSRRFTQKPGMIVTTGLVVSADHTDYNRLVRCEVHRFNSQRDPGCALELVYTVITDVAATYVITAD